jgi:hypothetical protein
VKAPVKHGTGPGTPRPLAEVDDEKPPARVDPTDSNSVAQSAPHVHPLVLVADGSTLTPMPSAVDAPTDEAASLT